MAAAGFCASFMSPTAVKAQPQVSTQTTLPSSSQSTSPVSVSGQARYARYSPVNCGVVAARISVFPRGERVLTWRDRWLETPETQRADSIAVVATEHAAAEEVRACLASKTVASTPPRQLWVLGFAWLGIHEDAKAQEAFTQALHNTAQASITERAWWLAQLVGWYLDPELARRNTAFAYMAQLDALGAPAAGFRLAARNKVYGLAAGADSIPFMVEQANLAVQLSHTLKGEMQHEWLSEILAAALNQADVDGRRKQYQSALDGLKEALKEFESVDPNLVHQILDPAISKATLIAQGFPMPVIQATAVYQPGQAKPASTITRPIKGRVSVFISGDHHFLGETPSFVLYRFAQRVVARFGDQVDVTLLGTVSGWNGDRLISVENELTLFQTFFHDYMRMTVPLVVYAPKVTEKARDGHLIREHDPNSIAMVVLVDKQGRIREYFNGLNEGRWMRMIDEMVHE